MQDFTFMVDKVVRIQILLKVGHYRRFAGGSMVHVAQN